MGMGRIVVGVDGSDGSRRALRWAADEARLRGADLEVVYAYEYHGSWLAYGVYEGATSPAQVDAIRANMESASREAAKAAQALVDRLVEGLDAPNVTGEAVQSSHAAETLVEMSEDADMLVVGSRGRGGFRSLVLGSVSHQCAQHATCPVVIIRQIPDASD
jgi:nucleotide-binding universal stress UspA family protein